MCDQGGPTAAADCPLSSPASRERDEYIHSLQLWINEARAWHTASFYLPYCALSTRDQSGRPNAGSPIRGGGALLRNIRRDRGPRHLFRAGNAHRQPPITLSPGEGLEFVIPPVWKRILAEGVDFIILFVAKLVMTLIALELLDKSDWTAIRDNVSSNIIELSLDPEITNGLIFLEALHRIMVCIYEIYWLHGAADVQFGCATPGKALMGLTVVVATRIRDIEPNNPNSSRVLLYPGHDLGLLIAAGRAFIKNVVLALMFPFCFAMFIFQFNRTGYDIMCNTIVVEYDPDPPKRNWP